MKISVIVPIYKVENYLKKCLESIVNQTYFDLEIILVNDGSPDNSFSIAQQFAQQDTRIVLISQENKGLSAARNAGLDIATGDYIAFVDSDDWLSLNYFELLVAAATEFDADIVSCPYKEIFETEQRKNFFKKHSQSKFSKKQVHDIVYLKYASSKHRKVFSNLACSKIYKKHLFDSLRFPLGRNFEDQATGYRYYHKATTFVHITGCFYFYLKRKNAITSSPSFKNQMDRILALEETIAFLKETGYHRKYIIHTKSLLISLTLVILAHNSKDNNAISLGHSIINKYKGLCVFRKLKLKYKCAYMTYKVSKKLYLKIFPKFIARGNTK
ncbi:MAG: glycosyltransferase family 2 protein [Firmicutes bacterium]|nr:glycosyltransferase family 2 protein [Bacillota bacterium]